MTDLERQSLLALLNEGRATHFWMTRNYLVQNWDGSMEWTRMMFPPRRGTAKIEADKIRDAYGDERQTYTTEDASHFVARIVRYC